MSPEMQPDDPGDEQPFVSHLIELRDRLLRMGIAIFVVLLILFPFANGLYSFVAAPLMAQLPEGSTMIATQVAAPFLTPFKLALVAAVFIAMPYLLYQLWAFVAPGLYQNEKRLARPLLASSIALFYIGVAFAYFVVFPLIFRFLTSTTPQGVEMMTDISAYLDFVLTLFFAFGVAFEIPIATILLVAVGITTPENLVGKRPYVIVGVFVVGMLLTPPDVISQTLLAVPMWMLFELGILFSRILLKDRNRRREDEDPDPTPPGHALGHDSVSDGTFPAQDDAAATSAPERGNGHNAQEGESSGSLESSHSGTSSELDGEAGADLHESRLQAGEVAEDSSYVVDHEEEEPPINSVEAKLRRANRLRELDNPFAARQVLYEVLEEGDADARRVARNILAQLDEG